MRPYWCRLSLKLGACSARLLTLDIFTVNSEYLNCLFHVIGLGTCSNSWMDPLFPGLERVRLFRGSSPTMTHFAVRGERSCGTNYLQNLIRRHTTLKVLDIGWKHGFYFKYDEPLHDQLLIFVVVRNWYDWTLSMYRKPWHASREVHSLEFSEFIRATWQTVYLRGTAANGQRCAEIKLQDDLNPLSGRPFSNIYQLRNAKHNFLLGLQQRHSNVVYLQYEWLIGNEALLLEKLNETFSIPISCFIPISTRFGSDYRAFPAITRPPSPDAICLDDLGFIDGVLDWSTEGAIGYHRNIRPK